MNLINKEFKTLQDLNSEIFNEILSVLNRQKKGRFILSGGNSPKYLFKSISKNKKYFKESTFLMSDERIIDIEDPESNEGEFLRLSDISSENLISLRDIEIMRKLNDIDYYDIAVLGMGEDGHFASIFPNCLNTNVAINSQSNIISFEDRHLDFPRISLSLNEILKSKKIILIASSKSKQSILRNKKNLPIHYLLQKSSQNLSIFNCN